MPAHDLKPAAIRSCKCCEQNIIGARATYAYRRIFLYERHQDLWDSQDAAEREREQRRNAR